MTVRPFWGRQFFYALFQTAALPAHASSGKIGGQKGKEQ